jgi:hypothetical protein
MTELEALRNGLNSPTPEDELRAQVVALGDLAKALFEAQFARHGGRKLDDPEWDEDDTDREEWWEQARNAHHVCAPIVDQLRAELTQVRGALEANTGIDPDTSTVTAINSLIWLHAEAAADRNRLREHVRECHELQNNVAYVLGVETDWDAAGRKAVLDAACRLTGNLADAHQVRHAVEAAMVRDLDTVLWLHAEKVAEVGYTQRTLDVTIERLGVSRAERDMWETEYDRVIHEKLDELTTALADRDEARERSSKAHSALGELAFELLDVAPGLTLLEKIHTLKARAAERDTARDELARTRDQVVSFDRVLRRVTTALAPLVGEPGLDGPGHLAELAAAELVKVRRDVEFHLQIRLEVEHLLDKALGTEEEDGAGAGLVADVALLADRLAAAREELATARDRMVEWRRDEIRLYQHAARLAGTATTATPTVRPGHKNWQNIYLIAEGRLVAVALEKAWSDRIIAAVNAYDQPGTATPDRARLENLIEQELQLAHDGEGYEPAAVARGIVNVARYGTEDAPVAEWTPTPGEWVTGSVQVTGEVTVGRFDSQFEDVVRLDIRHRFPNTSRAHAFVDATTVRPAADPTAPAPSEETPNA